MQEDFDEAEAVFGALCGLASHTETAPKIANFIPQLVQASNLLISNTAFLRMLCAYAGSCVKYACLTWLPSDAAMERLVLLLQVLDCQAASSSLSQNLILVTPLLAT